MKTIIFALCTTSTLVLGSSSGWAQELEPGNVAADVSRQDVLDTMKKATRFMTEEVAVKGGHVWSYLPDMSKRWGEMEAYETMVWVQPPGTATMGHLFLDAYHATGDEYYYEAAQQTAGALI